ncbi:hypothetical protein WISP_136683 [Willisornis vidua]|uniref:Uncharacterized protein n=1 Tax=Willisornis vidua TaxID=1566151 RepID=A0ABQ9CP85_9PASS|nr:hypothetical protein WISP_136683 [Willisornis vidua]
MLEWVKAQRPQTLLELLSTPSILCFESFAFPSFGFHVSELLSSFERHFAEEVIENLLDVEHFCISEFLLESEIKPGLVLKYPNVVIGGLV